MRFHEADEEETGDDPCFQTLTHQSSLIHESGIFNISSSCIMMVKLGDGTSCDRSSHKGLAKMPRKDLRVALIRTGPYS